MSKTTLTLTQKGRYADHQVYITAESITPLLHIVDALKASDVDAYGMTYSVTDANVDLYWFSEVEEDA